MWSKFVLKFKLIITNVHRNRFYKRHFFIFLGFLFYFKFFMSKTEKPMANVTHLPAQQCHIWHYRYGVGVYEHLVSAFPRLCGWCNYDVYTTTRNDSPGERAPTQEPVILCVYSTCGICTVHLLFSYLVLQLRCCMRRIVHFLDFQRKRTCRCGCVVGPKISMRDQKLSYFGIFIVTVLKSVNVRPETVGNIFSFLLVFYQTSTASPRHN